MSESIAMLQQV